MRRLTIAVCVCSLALTATALAAVNGTFKGKTSAGGKVVIHVVNGIIKKSPASTIRFVAPCTSKMLLKGATGVSGALHAGNSFSIVNNHYRLPLGGGYTGRFTTTIRFSIHNGAATGTYNNQAAIVHRGKVIDHCATGKLTFSAK